MSLLTSEERVRRLAESFHVLCDHPHVTHWDAIKLDRWAAQVASHGERLAAQFVLRVWNVHEDWECGHFDPVEAWATWDAANWEAFRAWVDFPFLL